MESCLALEYIQLNNIVERPFYVSTAKRAPLCVLMIVILGTLNINRNREHSFGILSEYMWDFILFYSHKPPWTLKIAITKGSLNENFFFDCQRMQYFVCSRAWALTLFGLLFKLAWKREIVFKLITKWILFVWK